MYYVYCEIHECQIVFTGRIKMIDFRITTFMGVNLLSSSFLKALNEI